MARFTTAPFVALLIAPLALTGCGGSDTDTNAGANGSSARNTNTASTPAWVLASSPGESLGIVDAKASASQGDEIVLRGRIGGRVEPLSEESPVFTIIDLSLPYCGEVNEDDNCPTPWDYCCDSPETIRANAATVQIVDETGTPVSDSPMTHGLEPLDEVIVTGTVGPRPTQDVLTVRATGVYRVTQ
jgi:hypothetical protein